MDLSFLYQTRTILCLGRVYNKGLRAGAFQARSLSCRLGSPEHRQDDKVNWKEKYFKQQAGKRRRAEIGEPEPEAEEDTTPPTTTITDNERRAFARLQELAVRQQYADHSSDSERLSTDPESILALFPGSPRGRRESSSEGSDETPAAPYVLNPTTKQDQDHSESTATSRQSSPSDDLITKICLHQLCHYLKSFLDALKLKDQPKDLAVFEVLKSQVFPLIGLITPPSPASSKPPDASKPSKKARTQPPPQSGLENLLPMQEILRTVSPTTKAPSKIPPLPLVSRLYPAAILLALRILTKQQPLSPITSSLLSEVRNLGATSYVLAANTHFYNTFLLLRWNLYSSLPEICSLLSEMERGAAEFDRGTARFLRDVADERARDLYAESSSEQEQEADEMEVKRGARWWQKSEQVKWWPRIEEWRATIARSLEEKGGGDVIREGPYSSLMAEEVLTRGREGNSREVWL